MPRSGADAVSLRLSTPYPTHRSLATQGGRHRGGAVQQARAARAEARGRRGRRAAGDREFHVCGGVSRFYAIGTAVAWRCTKVSPVDVHTGRARRPSRARKQRRPRNRSASSLEVERAVSLYLGWLQLLFWSMANQRARRRSSPEPYRTTMPVLWSARGPSARVSFRTSLHYHLTARP